MGIEDSVIKVPGGWESTAYQLYVRLPRSSLGAVPQTLLRRSKGYSCQFTKKIVQIIVYIELSLVHVVLCPLCNLFVLFKSVQF